MIQQTLHSQAPVPQAAYQPTRARFGPAHHIDAFTLVTALHLLTQCRLAVRLAHRRCPPPVPAGSGGAARIYSTESLLLLALLCTLWRLSDAVIGHAPTQHTAPLFCGYRVHTLLCRGSGLPLFFLLSSPKRVLAHTWEGFEL
jgi:hypothetical protein